MSKNTQLQYLLKLISGLFIFPVISFNSQAASADCANSNCLHVYSNTISARRFNQGYNRHTVLVKVVDQHNTVAGAMGAVVHGLWMLPDGTSLEQYSTVSRRGRANFRHYSSNQFGEFTFQVLDVSKSGYGFDPATGAPLTVTYDLQNPGNIPPVALINADATEGLAPLPINFFGSGSTDSDGTIVGYHWDFGDGITSELADPVHTYLQPGNYQAALTVSDNQGATANASTNILVNPAAGLCNNSCLHTNSINMTVYRPAWSISSSRVTAKILVLDQKNQAMQGVTVNVVWTLPDGSRVEQSQYIDPDNWKHFADLKVSAVQIGDYQLHITNIVADGYSFDASASVVSASISVSP